MHAHKSLSAKTTNKNLLIIKFFTLINVSVTCIY